MTIRFVKMHGLGNDFMVIDGIRQKLHLLPSQIKALAQRDTGIGFDQCLIVEESKQKGIDFFYRIINADGNEVAQCGNGARCIALFLQHYGLTTKKCISIATHTTLMTLVINPNGTVTVDMGLPKLKPKVIPFLAKSQSPTYVVPLADGTVQTIYAINVGNPHAIQCVESVDEVDVKKRGQEISTHSWFPEQTNVSFMQLINEDTIRLRVYERGCGETKACGSAAVAAAAVARLFHQFASKITVHLLGGELIVEWPDLKGSIFLTGPATFVYEGQLF